jgi:AcrR family transcriptional regulator
MAIADETKARLLEAAGEEFAAKGFEHARVRAISKRAGANVAAINYHFGGKEQLYVEAVLEAHRCGTHLISEIDLMRGSPAEQLRRYIHHFLSDVMSMNRANRWHNTLMLREMLQPTVASETLVREAIRPRFERLQAILRRACPDADKRRLNALAFSVVGQCLHYKVARPITERLIGTEAYKSLDLEYLTDHISSFCLAALGLAPPLGGAAGSAVVKDGVSAN